MCLKWLNFTPEASQMLSANISPVLVTDWALISSTNLTLRIHSEVSLVCFHLQIVLYPYRTRYPYSSIILQYHTRPVSDRELTVVWRAGNMCPVRAGLLLIRVPSKIPIVSVSG